MGNLFAVDRIFYGKLRPENIQFCIAIEENWKLLVLTLFFLKKIMRNLSVILWKLLNLEGVSINKSIAPELVTVKVSQHLKLI